MTNENDIKGLAQSRQSAKLFLQSSENEHPPNPHPPPNLPPPPRVWGGGDTHLFLGGGEHSLARKGLGESQFRRGAYTVVLFIGKYFVGVGVFKVPSSMNNIIAMSP
jgi:hypothetical protein